MDAQLHAFGYAPAADENQGPGMPRKIVRTAAAGTLAAGGLAAFKNRSAIAGAGKNVARTGLKKTASVAGQASNALHKTALKGSGLGMKAAGAGSTILQKASTGMRKVAKTFSRADVDNIIDLAARVAEMELEAEGVEFAEDQRSKLGMYVAGGPVGLYDQKKYRESGLALRKRDAFKDSVKGGVAGQVAGMGAGLGVLGGAAGLGVLAAKRKLPKGGLRKAGVSAARALKNGSPKLAVAAGGLGAATAVGTTIKVQHGSAEKRRKALLAQRLRGEGSAQA